MGANKLAYWKAIIDRIKNAFSTWKARWLSLSGRLLQIKTGLSAIPNYYMSILKAAIGVIQQVEKIIRGFLWRHNMSEEKKISLISIQEMAHDKGGGGVGLHDLSKRNIAFGGKLVWKMVSKPDTKWCRIMQEKYLDSLNPSPVGTTLDPPKGSIVWNFMMSWRQVITRYVSWEVHNGESIQLWEDSWNGLPPLKLSELLLDAIPTI
ncbi:uncharacterized protein LOC131874266 [Cryptomeria japonica]|uniref:uncharacterized protein LOC131874266 n=1 Tax=Cryptomeria japonica TaxID=3369 RepID=UPI0027DA45D8|nr:uncharacterized protein LOC131874266 [Cryptomeria japonica]